MKPSGNESGLAGVLSVATHRGVFQFYSLSRAAHFSNEAQQQGYALEGQSYCLARGWAEL
jgi:hypothetical protein